MQSAGKWVITPTTEHTINVEYSLFTDPGGNMPAWLINMFITKGPLESFKKLKEQIKNPLYTLVSLTDIKDR